MFGDSAMSVVASSRIFWVWLGNMPSTIPNLPVFMGSSCGSDSTISTDNSTSITTSSTLSATMANENAAQSQLAWLPALSYAASNVQIHRVDWEGAKILESEPHYLVWNLIHNSQFIPVVGVFTFVRSCLRVPLDFENSSNPHLSAETI